MKTEFNCTFYPKTDKVSVIKRSKDIAIELSGRENGRSHGEYWSKTVVLTPEDALKMADALEQKAGNLGFGEATKETVEVASKEPIETKVTAEQIDAIMKKAKVLVSTEFEKCTVVTVKLPNGFTITESSGCVDIANYDVHLGTEICLKKIRNKVWELEGYALQKRLSDMGVM